MDFSSSATGTRITLKVGKVGFAIGKKGKTIKRLSQQVKELLGSDAVQIEVDQLAEPELSAGIMAQRLASSLERGRHFRRTGYGTIRRVMSKGALGCEIVVAGKVTSQRARVEKFREGFIAKTGDPKRKFVDVGHAVAKIKRGVLGITVLIMKVGSVLPDDVTIIAESTHTSGEMPLEDVELLDSLESFEGEALESVDDLAEEFTDDLDELPEEAGELLEEENLELDE